MLAQALEVADLEAVLLQHRHHHADLVQLGVGEDVTIHELAVDPARVVANRPRLRPGGPMAFARPTRASACG